MLPLRLVLRSMISVMNRRTLILGAAGLGAIGLTGWLAYRETSKSAPPANRSLKSSAPNKTELDVAGFLATILPDLQGKDQPIKSFLGKPLVVNFWATWCAPCVQEMPILEEISKSRTDIQFIGIGIDTADNMRQFVAKVQVNYTLLVAGHSGISLVRALGNTSGGLPFTVMFDANGTMIDTILGQVDSADLTRKINDIFTK